MSLSLQSRRGRGGGRGRGRGRGRGGGGGGGGGGLGPGDAEEDDSSLFAVVRAGRALRVKPPSPPSSFFSSPLPCALQSVVDDWLGDYKESAEQALVSLLQFFVSSSGCRGVMTLTMMQSDDWPGVIGKLTEEFDEESGDYPLMMSGHSAKRFRNNFSDFISVRKEEGEGEGASRIMTANR